MLLRRILQRFEGVLLQQDLLGLVPRALHQMMGWYRLDLVIGREVKEIRGMVDSAETVVG
jgi:hypothetical protein